MNAPSAKSTIRLLLVDDDEVDRLACKRALARHPDYDFVVLEAETGEEGLALAREEKPDCILLDHYLPDFTGVELLGILAEETGGLAVPVVMLTGADNALLAVDALKRGARDYVVKDAERETLKWLPAVVIRALREQQTLLDKAEALEKLRKAEAKYRTLVEQIPAITYISSLEAPGRLLYVSPQTRQFGYTPEEILGDPQGLLKLVHPDDRKRVSAAFAQTFEHYTPLRCEYRIASRTGRLHWFLDEANVVRDEDSGHPLFLQGILVDITEDKEKEQELVYYRERLEELVARRTAELEIQSELLRAANANMDKELCERKRAEAALRESETRCRLVLETVCEGIFEIDAQGRCLFVNHVAVEMLGFTREELLGQKIATKIQAGDEFSPRGKHSIHRALREGAPFRSTETLLRRDGSAFPTELAFYPVHGDGRVTGAVLVFREAASAAEPAR